VDDECIVRTKVVLTVALPVEIWGALMVLITGRELISRCDKKREKFPGWNRIILEFYKTYWYRVLRVIF